jgi:hypothetical protein
MPAVRKQMPDDGYRVLSLGVRFCLNRPRPRNRKKYNGVEDEDEYEPEVKLNPKSQGL